MTKLTHVWKLICTGLSLVLCFVAAPAMGQSANPFGKPSASNPYPMRALDPKEPSATRPGGMYMNQTRSEVLARHGVVASSEPLATSAGLGILREGGNAIDAAVAMAATLALVEPQSCGIGAELFAIVWSARDKKLYQVSANGWAPASWNIEYFARRGFGQFPGALRTSVPGSGIYSAVIPGSVDGWDKLLKRFGTMTFRDVLEPAATYAEEGFPVHEVLAQSFRSNASSLINIDPDTKAIYAPDGKVPGLYSIFRNPDMARTFRLLQRHGRDVFYKGEIARAMVAKANKPGVYGQPNSGTTTGAGGATTACSECTAEWTYDDVALFEAEWAEPYSTNYHGYDFFETPAPSQGWAALEMANILEVCAPVKGINLATLGRSNPLYWHFMLEAKKLAYSDLIRYNADPRFRPPPLNVLLSKDYARGLCDLISLDTVRPADVLGNLPGGTIYGATADRWGNMVSLVYSVYSSFGSKVTVPGYGFQFSSRGAMFPLDPNHPNRPESPATLNGPRKRPFITIIASFLMKDNKPVMAFGNMGGGTQPQAHVQHLVNMIDLGYNVQATTDVGRFDHDQAGDEVSLDRNTFNWVTPSAPDGIGAALNAMPRTDGLPGGHKVSAGSGVGGGYQGILFERDDSLSEPQVPVSRASASDQRNPLNGVYRAGSDHRKDGHAAGF